MPEGIFTDQFFPLQPVEKGVDGPEVIIDRGGGGRSDGRGAGAVPAVAFRREIPEELAQVEPGHLADLGHFMLPAVPDEVAQQALIPGYSF